MIRVLVVDDSPTVRHHLLALLGSTPDLQVVGEAESGQAAIRMVDRLRPDVVSLDVFMTGASAAETVRQVLSEHAVPIVLVSDAPRDAAEVFAALDAGAVDFVAKPRHGDAAAAAWFLDSIRAMSQVRVRRRKQQTVRPRDPAFGHLAAVVVGSSAGGPVALREFLAALPPTFSAPVIIAQHFALGFEAAMASWLSRESPLPVRVAELSDKIRGGEILLLRPGHDGAITSPEQITQQPAPPRGYHPSVDLLFESAASMFGGETAAVVFSGIGHDGLQGARMIRSAGGVVLAQDAESAAVDGMPRSVRDAQLASVTGTPAMLGAWLRMRLNGTTAAGGWKTT